MVTHGPNLPRHGTEGPAVSVGLTQPGVFAKTAGRSIKRTVQLRKMWSDGHCWASGS